MSLLGNMKSEGLEVQEDRLGGFQLRKTDIYPAKIKMAYITKSPNGAVAMNLSFDINGTEFRQNGIYFTNRNGENFFYPKDDKGNPDTTKPKQQNPNFALINAMCRLAVGQELHELDDTVEEKTVKVWDSTEKKEINKSLPVVTGLLGAEILIAITEQTVNKSEKNDQTGNYDPIAESRDENIISHFFHFDTKASLNEMDKALKAEAEGKEVAPFTFADQWLERYQGKKADARTIKTDGATPKSGKPSSSAPAAGAKAATSSLFNKNKS